MKVTALKDGVPVRKLVTACATNRTVLAAVAEKWDDKEGLLDSRHANIIVNWCVHHYRKYGKPPRHNLEAIHDAWSNKTQDKELAKSVESLMLQLSAEYESKAKVQEDYVIDLAAKLFKKVQLRKRNREIEALLELGDVDKATSLAETYAPIQMGGRAWVDVTSADHNLKRALKKAQEPPLITWPGAAGQFLGNTFRRGGFVCFEGPDGRGKTTTLTDIAYRAICQDKKVAFFAVGDMSADEMLELFASRGSGHPKAGDGTEFKYPISMTVQGTDVHVVHEDRTKPELTYGAARKFWRKFEAKHGGGLLRVSAYPNDSVSILGLQAELNNWQRRGWSPDMICVDYLDLLTPMDSNKFTETREQIDKTWKKARGMAQIYNACVVTVAQTDSDAYTAEVITMKNFSGSKGKNAHVTAMLGLNQTDTLKEQGVMGWNFPKRRRGKAITSQMLYIAGCPAIGQTCILSSM